MSSRRLLSAALVIGAVSSSASADPLADVAIHRPLTLATGNCEASLVVESNESVRSRLEPISLAPDLHCGVHPRITVGVTHSARSLSLVDSGSGLCLRGRADGCDHRYGGTALDVLSPIRDRYDPDVAVAARARLVASSFSPLRPSLRLGALIRLRRGAAAMVFDPHLTFGLANRDRGNRDQLNVPLVGEVQLGRRAMVSVRSGVRGELATFGDAFAVPIGAGVEFSPSPPWDIGLEAAFPRLLGPQNTTKERHLALYITFRFAAPSLVGGEAVSSTAEP